MIVWFILILFVLFLKFYMGNLHEKKKQKKFLVISGIVIILVMGLRYPDYEIVYDLRGYYNYYNQMISTPWSQILLISRFEPGYAILNKTLATIIPWPQFILIFEAAFSVLCISKFIYKNSDYPFQAIIFYITLGTMTFQLTAFRQAFAIGICLLSIEFIKEKRFLRFLITVLLAMTFHKTAVVFLPFYFIANRSPNWKNNLISLIAIICSVLLADYFTDIGNKIFDMQYGGYIGNTFGGLVPIVLYTIIILFSLIYSRKIKNKIPLNMTIVGLSIYLMRYATLALERISFFYTPASIVQLPNVINMVKDKNTKILINFVSIVLAIALFVYRLQNSDYANYRFFWQ